MTGDEHRQEAERLTQAARDDVRNAQENAQGHHHFGYKLALDRAMTALAAAQVHATLHLAAEVKSAARSPLSYAGGPG